MCDNCDKTQIAALRKSNIDFVNDVCINKKICSKLSIVELKDKDNIITETYYICKKHGKGVMALIMNNPNFICTNE